MEIEVSVGIATYNSEDVISRCLSSIYSQTIKPLEVIVVDNDSRDGTVEIIRGEFPDVTILQNHENVGFGAAQNRAILSSHARFYLALNDDVLLERDYLEKLLNIMDRDDTIASVMGRVMYSDVRGISNGVVYSMGHVLSPALHGRSLNHGLVYTGNGTAPFEVFGVNAACALYRRSLLEKVAFAPGEYYDRLYFMYHEDVDLDWRIRSRGWRSLCIPDAVAFHSSGGQKNYRDFRIKVHSDANEYMNAIKNLRVLSLLRVFPFYAFEFTWNLIAHPRRTSLVFAIIWRNFPEIRRKRKSVMRDAVISPRQLQRFVMGTLGVFFFTYFGAKLRRHLGRA